MTLCVCSVGVCVQCVDVCLSDNLLRLSCDVTYDVCSSPIIPEVRHCLKSNPLILLFTLDRLSS